ncbi:MAG TPA: DoxX family protein [Flavobacteriaceae bacterium]|nr:DoxX family protein [Alteromonas sp.]HPF12349.1 DoxX family protein [Flavobacteriaceae bacterium]HQU22504.1 DoxX family protein [Flavobacteriaceae bacterium]HQU66454.1 DoxX family protein [Flavobacteriaceae bacterium]
MKKKILFILCLLFGLMFINAGLNKFFNYMPAPDDIPENMIQLMGAIDQFGWLMPLIGLVEVLGGILIILPKTRALGAIVIFPIMVGIMLTHLINSQMGLPIASVLFVILLWVLYENRKKYAGLIG